MIFDFSDKINQHGLKIIFSNTEESNILTKKAIVTMTQIHSINIEIVNNKDYKSQYLTLEKGTTIQELVNNILNLNIKHYKKSKPISRILSRGCPLG